MRHKVTPATVLTGTASSSATCMPVSPMPVSRPLGVANEASVASPSPLLSSILPASSIPLLPACVTFPDLAHCETFEDAINASNVYSQPNIAAKAAAEGRRLLEAGLGVDHTLVAANVEHIAHNGLRHLLEKCSELLKHRTLQSVSKRRDPPSRGLQLFPVCPFPGADDSRSNEHVSKQAAETMAVQSSAPLSLAADVPIPCIRPYCPRTPTAAPCLACT
jgi:hypothetical protein